jgi:aspartyl-tRNA(Asn)/glutamyl-tRNA(Gln) amidotransferase subunit C
VSPLTAKDVAEIAGLARLALGADEAERMRGDLTAILGYMEMLADLDTTGVEPMTHAVPMELRLREDEVAPSYPVGVALGQAPDRAGDFFAVPRILDKPSGGGADA